MQLTSLATSKTSTPLETLVIQQLAAVLREEQLLSDRFRKLNSLGTDESAVDVFSAELSKFNERASRLMRLMEAMEGYSSNPQRVEMV